MITPEITLINEIRAYFNLNLNEYDIKRLKKVIGEYKKKVPPITIYQKVIVEKEVPVEVVGLGRLPPTEENLDNIALEVCDRHKITISQLKFRCREDKYVTPRYEFIKVANLRTRVSQTQLANYLGYKSHSSVNHLLHDRRKSNTSKMKEILS